jgi:ABC-type cobalamin transport system ATPase subunit
LKRKVQELEMLRLRLAPGLLSLADEYHAALRTYLEQRNKTSFFLPFRRAGILRHAKEQATKQLDDLDARRMALRPKLEPTTTAKTEL